MEINKPMTTRNMLASTLTDYRKPVKLLKMRGDGAPALRHTQGERRAHVRRGEGGIMTAQAPCAKIARQDPDLADRMWATITVGGREVVDAEKRALGRRVCEVLTTGVAQYSRNWSAETSASRRASCTTCPRNG